MFTFSAGAAEELLNFIRTRFWVVNMPPDRHALVFMFLRVFVSIFTRVSCRHSNEICRRTTLEQKNVSATRGRARFSRFATLPPLLKKNSIAPWEKTFEWWGSRAEKNTLSIIHSRSLIIMRMLGILSYEPLHRKKILLFVEFWVKNDFSIVWPSAPLLLGRSSHSESLPSKLLFNNTSRWLRSSSAPKSPLISRHNV